MKTITINLPEEVELDKVKMIIAASLFEQGIMSSGQAAELVGITRRQFLEEIGKYGVSVFGETAEDIEKLSDKTNFRISSSIKEQVLKKAGEL